VRDLNPRGHMDHRLSRPAPYQARRTPLRIFCSEHNLKKVSVKTPASFLWSRVSTSVFMRNYYNPSWIKDLKTRTLKKSCKTSTTPSLFYAMISPLWYSLFAQKWTPYVFEPLRINLCWFSLKVISNFLKTESRPKTT
jgi:hypothetical protein